MKQILLLTFSILIISLVQAQTPEQTVIELSKKKFEWMTRMQYDSLEALLDDRLMLFTLMDGQKRNPKSLRI